MYLYTEARFFHATMIIGEIIFNIRDRQLIFVLIFLPPV